jgi:hypothetical protein
MSDIAKSEICARNLVNNLMPFLPPSSIDVKDEYEAGEFVAAAHGAIHDLGVLRTDIPLQLIQDIEALLLQIEEEDDAFNLRFLASMRAGYDQLLNRCMLANSIQSA